MAGGIRKWGTQAEKAESVSVGKTDGTGKTLDKVTQAQEDEH